MGLTSLALSTISKSTPPFMRRIPRRRPPRPAPTMRTLGFLGTDCWAAERLLVSGTDMFFFGFWWTDEWEEWWSDGVMAWKEEKGMSKARRERTRTNEKGECGVWSSMEGSHPISSCSLAVVVCLYPRCSQNEGHGEHFFFFLIAKTWLELKIDQHICTCVCLVCLESLDSLDWPKWKDRNFHGLKRVSIKTTSWSTVDDCSPSLSHGVKHTSLSFIIYWSDRYGRSGCWLHFEHLQGLVQTRLILCFRLSRVLDQRQERSLRSTCNFLRNDLPHEPTGDPLKERPR